MKYERILAGLRVLQGAWGSLSPSIARVAETDDETHACWRKIDEGLSDLDRLIRKRIRDREEEAE